MKQVLRRVNNQYDFIMLRGVSKRFKKLADDIAVNYNHAPKHLWNHIQFIQKNDGEIEINLQKSRLNLAKALKQKLTSNSTNASKFSNGKRRPRSIQGPGRFYRIATNPLYALMINRHILSLPEESHLLNGLALVKIRSM